MQFSSKKNWSAFKTESFILLPGKQEFTLLCNENETRNNQKQRENSLLCH